jgi:hypothetical protein
LRDAGFAQNAIHAVADLEIRFERLDVNIGRTFPDGFEKKIVDQFDDAGFLSHLDFVCITFRESADFVHVTG